MMKSGALKLSIVFFVTFILCLPEFFPKVSQIEFICEPCTPEKETDVCAHSDPTCATEIINAGSQHINGEGWYLCTAEIDLQLLHNHTSESGDPVMVLITMKAGNLSGWNYSVFAFLNNTDLYTGPQNDQSLFYCCLPPNNSTCLDLNISIRENTSPLLKTTTSAKQMTSLLKATTSFEAANELKCQPTPSRFLFYYQEHNLTARSAALPVAPIKREGCCVILSVWLALILSLLVVSILSVGYLIVKSSERYYRKSQMATYVSFTAGRHQLKESNVPDVSIEICSITDDDVLSKISSTEENLLKVSDLMYKRRLSPIYEISEISLDEEEENEDREDEHCKGLVTKKELNKSHQLQLAAQVHCEPTTYLHHRSNFSYSSHEENGA